MNITLPTYSAVILGALDSLPDYPFTITYYTNNKRDAVPSYYNCVAPFSIELLDAFTNRPNGDVDVYRNGVLLDSFNVDNVGYAIGGRNRSITVSGSKQDTNASPITYPLELSQVVSEARNSFGQAVLSLVPISAPVRPADSVIYKGDTRLVLTTAFSVGSRVNTTVLTLEEVAP